MDAKRISAYTRIKGMVRSCLILTFLLGITWIVGIPMVLAARTLRCKTIVLGYVFDYLNCSIGIFIFLYSVIGDAKMREATKICIQRNFRRLASKPKAAWKGVKKPVSMMNESMRGSLKNIRSRNNNSHSYGRKISGTPTLTTTLSLNGGKSDASDDVRIVGILNDISKLEK